MAGQHQEFGKIAPGRHCTVVSGSLVSIASLAAGRTEV